MCTYYLIQKEDLELTLTKILKQDKERCKKRLLEKNINPEEVDDVVRACVQTFLDDLFPVYLEHSVY